MFSPTAQCLSTLHTVRYYVIVLIAKELTGRYVKLTGLEEEQEEAHEDEAGDVNRGVEVTDSPEDSHIAPE